MSSPFYLLVLGQFSSIAVILVGGSWLLALWGLFALGLLVFAAALASMGRNNFTVLLDPRSTNTLSQRGIHRWVSHPMYSALLMCGAVVAFGAPSLERWVALLFCLLVLMIKVRHEEGLLTAHYS